MTQMALADIAPASGAAGGEALHTLLRHCERQAGVMRAGFGDYRLNSAFQPIFSFAHARTVGCEALVRACDASQAAVSPDRLFASVRRPRDLELLDGLCRTVHLANFASLNLDGWLFLNVDPGTLRGAGHGALFFDQLIDTLSVARERVVVEILEKRIPDEQVLTDSVELYRSFGCLIALDDFGVGQSNFDRIWRLAPEIVKLDRQLLAHAIANQRVRRSLPNLVKLLHQAGCTVLAEGVEREDEALLAVDAGVDLAQGFFFARPQPMPERGQPRLDVALDPHPRLNAATLRLASQHQARLAPYRAGFQDVVDRVSNGQPAEAALDTLLGLDQATDFCTLDSQGQVRTGVIAPHPERPAGTRAASAGAGRAAAPGSALRRALAAPGEVQYTGPHRARRGNAICNTLSCAVRRGAETLVLCLDVGEPAPA